MNHECYSPYFCCLVHRILSVESTRHEECNTWPTSVCCRTSLRATSVCCWTSLRPPCVCCWTSLRLTSVCGMTSLWPTSQYSRTSLRTTSVYSRTSLRPTSVYIGTSLWTTSSMTWHIRHIMQHDTYATLCSMTHTPHYAVWHIRHIMQHDTYATLHSMTHTPHYASWHIRSINYATWLRPNYSQMSLTSSVRISRRCRNFYEYFFMNKCVSK